MYIKEIIPNQHSQVFLAFPLLMFTNHLSNSKNLSSHLSHFILFTQYNQSPNHTSCHFCPQSLHVPHSSAARHTNAPVKPPQCLTHIFPAFNFLM